MKHGKVVILSRESDRPTLDISLLEQELKKREGMEVVVLCKMLKHNYFSYFVHMLRQIREIRSSDVIVADTYIIPVSLFRHREDQTVIQIWHALGAIKQFGWQTVGRSGGRSGRIAHIMKMHAGYDRILCASDITAEYFCEAFRAGRDKIVKLGLPRIDYILRDDPDMLSRIYERYPQIKQGKNAGRKTVLYVPTFRRGRPVDVRPLAEALGRDRYDLVVKLHPIDEEQAEHIDGVIYDREFDSYDMLRAADIVISDYSSYVIEATLADKPLYLYLYDLDEYREQVGLNMDPAQEPISDYVFEDAGELAAALDRPYDIEKLRRFRDRYIDIDTDRCTERLADYIAGLAGESR